MGLKAPRGTLEKLIRVSDDLKVFEKRLTFVESVSLANDGVIFRLNPRHDLRPIAVRMENAGLPAIPPSASAWWVQARLGTGAYNVVIELDGQCAYDAIVRLNEIPF